MVRRQVGLAGEVMFFMTGGAPLYVKFDWVLLKPFNFTSDYSAVKPHYSLFREVVSN